MNDSIKIKKTLSDNQNLILKRNFKSLEKKCNIIFNIVHFMAEATSTMQHVTEFVVHHPFFSQF